jgi:hypothetical protein
MLFNFFNGTTPRLAIRIYAATMMPVFLIIKQLIVKGSFMAQDLMMPVRRDAYLKQVGMSFAVSQFILWGVFFIVLWIFTPVAKPTPEFLIISISYSLMIQIWLFGLGVWISSLRSIPMNFLFFIAVIASSIPITHFDVQMMTPWWPLLLGDLLVCLGLFFTYLGYRRWMVADF